ncbi:hypothetical protein L210DRAFT_947370, partial [Boletus edulis BED1]
MLFHIGSWYTIDWPINITLFATKGITCSDALPPLGRYLPFKARRAKATMQWEARCKQVDARANRDIKAVLSSSMFDTTPCDVANHNDFNHRQPLGKIVQFTGIKSRWASREGSTYAVGVVARAGDVRAGQMASRKLSTSSHRHPLHICWMMS